MTDGQVRDEVLTLLLAGHETTANALAWTWLLLDRHPAAADRLHAEVDARRRPGPRSGSCPGPGRWSRSRCGSTRRPGSSAGGCSPTRGSPAGPSPAAVDRDGVPVGDPPGPPLVAGADRVPAGAVDRRRRVRRGRPRAAAGGVLPVRDGPPGLRGRVVRLDRGGAGARGAGPRLDAGSGARPPGRRAARGDPSARCTGCG